MGNEETQQARGKESEREGCHQNENSEEDPTGEEGKRTKESSTGAPPHSLPWNEERYQTYMSNFRLLTRLQLLNGLSAYPLLSEITSNSLNPLKYGQMETLEIDGLPIDSDQKAGVIGSKLDSRLAGEMVRVISMGELSWVKEKEKERRVRIWFEMERKKKKERKRVRERERES